MNSKEWTNIIVVMVVVAIVGSFVSSSLTGGVIKVSPTTTASNVYTTAEVDAKLSGKIVAKEFQATGGPIAMTDPSWYIWSDGYIGANNLKGTSNAYACITFGGVITRSSTARI